LKTENINLEFFILDIKKTINEFVIKETIHIL